MAKKYDHLDAEVWEWCGLYKNILKSDDDSNGAEEASFRESAILMLSREARARVSDLDALAIELIPQMLVIIKAMASMDRAVWDRSDRKLASQIADACKDICTDLRLRPKPANLQQKEERLVTTRKLNIDFDKEDTDVTR